MQNALMQPQAASLLDAYQTGQRNALTPGRQLWPGNIDLHARPVVRNADGSVSTVRSATITDDAGRAVLIPTVIDGRGVVPIDEAVRFYRQTGQHLGIFDTISAADAYAQRLHEAQAQEYLR